MKKIIKLEIINGFFAGAIGIWGIVIDAIQFKNLPINLITFGSILVIWLISLTIALWNNNTILNSENSTLKSNNSDLTTKLKKSEGNRGGLKKQISEDEAELQSYGSQVSDLKNINEKLFRESTAFIGLLLANSPSKQFLYEQIEALQTASLGNEIYNLNYLNQELIPIIQTKEKLLLEQEK